MPVALTQRAVILLAMAGTIVTANAYYIHPIIGKVAAESGVSNAIVGAVPALNQIVLALLIMAVAQSFLLYVAGSTLLDFFTITPYLLPAFVSRRVSGNAWALSRLFLLPGQLPDDYSECEPPDPISNSEVKLLSAMGVWGFPCERGVMNDPCFKARGRLHGCRQAGTVRNEFRPAPLRGFQAMVRVVFDDSRFS